MCFVGFEGLEPPAYLLDWIRAGRVGGVILFARNIASPGQVANLTDTLQAAAPDGVLVSIDQEGGVVARLREAQGFTEVPGAMALASAGGGTEHAERVAGVLAAEMRAIGVHWDYAPVVDVSYNAANPAVGTRSYGSSAAFVGKLAPAFVRGLQAGSNGVAACAKHFPGLGSTAIDTHLALPALDTPLEHLRAVDLYPYRQLIAETVASVMVTHTIYATLDPALPATLSPVVVRQLLRGELGYDGVVATDCMEMKAIADNFGAGESAVLAALAGIDSILFSHTPARQEAAYEALLAAAQSGRLPLDVIEMANLHLEVFRQTYLKPRGDLSVIRAPEHLAIAREAARAGVTLVKRGEALPLPDGTVGVVEFPSALESGIVESGGLTGFARRFRERLPKAEVAIWRRSTSGEAMALARRVGTLVLATRSAHLNPDQLAAARSLIAHARRTVVVALRNPYDADVLGNADSVVCTCGDAVPSLEAAVAVLAGDFIPTGSLPVSPTLDDLR